MITTTKPEEAVENADIIVTDTWIIKDQKVFKGYQISMDMLKGANKGWVFLHCLPRKKEEVNDEVFYSKRSLVFPEAENRKWTIMANLMSGYTPLIVTKKPQF